MSVISLIPSCGDRKSTRLHSKPSLRSSALQPLPTILLLAGDDKHLLPRPRLAIFGNVDVRNIAHPVLRRSEEHTAALQTFPTLFRSPTPPNHPSAGG